MGRGRGEVRDKFDELINKFITTNQFSTISNMMMQNRLWKRPAWV